MPVKQWRAIEFRCRHRVVLQKQNHYSAIPLSRGHSRCACLVNVYTRETTVGTIVYCTSTYIALSPPECTGSYDTLPMLIVWHGNPIYFSSIWNMLLCQAWCYAI